MLQYVDMSKCQMASILLIKRINNNDAYHASKLVLVNMNPLRIGCNLLVKRYWGHIGYPGGIKFRSSCGFGILLLVKVILLSPLGRGPLDENILKRLLIVGIMERIDYTKTIQYIDV
ncbi:50S ribosomal protein L13 [Candidatus Hodgkinia cicadicola]|uniref:50S ribosomal protein L13 n=1 Tax=Candidatus Hodgkinia cicadicola TaxID=573658 RepID=A0ABX4MHM3_9HYPH|nr:50S ribosomal protein L13 [Candidatus Hodgkinia cicadicola]